MKFSAAIFLTISFISIAVFGVFNMHHGMSAEKGINCIASAINGESAPCPKENPLGFASFHFNAFKIFSSSFLVQTMILILAFVMFARLLAIFSLNQPVKNQGLEKNFTQFFEPKFNFWNFKNLSWLTLHENSPSFFKMLA